METCTETQVNRKAMIYDSLQPPENVCTGNVLGQQNYAIFGHMPVTTVLS